jgi:hypothetical protein
LAALSTVAFIPVRVQALLLVPWIALCIQLCLWPFPLFLRWRLTHAVLPSPPREWWTLRDFFAGTFVLSVALAALKGCDGRELNAQRFTETSLIFILSPFVILLPTAWYVLRLRRAPMIGLAASIHLVSLFAAIGAYGVMSNYLDPEAFGFVLIAIGFSLGGTLLGVVCLRTSGYRLIWGRETQ